MLPPKIKHKVEPSYSAEALRAQVQGTVVVEIVVNQTGEPVDLSVLSPLGFGLDQKALEVISTWRFEPGRKDGRAVNTRVSQVLEFNANPDSPLASDWF